MADHAYQASPSQTRAAWCGASLPIRGKDCRNNFLKLTGQHLVVDVPVRRLPAVRDVPRLKSEFEVQFILDAVARPIVVGLQHVFEKLQRERRDAVVLLFVPANGAALGAHVGRPTEARTGS